MKRTAKKLGMLACMAALVCAALTACAAPSPAANDAQQANRAYMSQVNSIMRTLGENLDSFVDAVSRGDVVNMRTQADNAYKTLDSLDSTDAPESLSDVKQKYVDGTTKLREALDAYITLYTEMESDSFDQSTYSDRLAKVQSLYDEGVDLLKQADEAAASK